MTAIRIIVDNKNNTRNGETGVVQSTILNSERGFFVAARFGDRIEVINHKDFKIHPEDVERMDRELSRERTFLGVED